MPAQPTSPLPIRLGLFLRERAHPLDAAGAMAGAAALAAYGAALAGAAITPGVLAAAAAFAGLAYLHCAILGPDQASAGALSRGTVAPADIAGLAAVLAAAQLVVLAGIDPPLAAFAPAAWAVLTFTRPRRAPRPLLIAAVVALAALLAGAVVAGAPAMQPPSMLRAALGAAAALAVAGLAAAADSSRFAARGPAVAAATAIAAPVLLVAAVERGTGPALVAGLAALAAMASVGAAAAALGHASPRRAARLVHVFAGFAVLALLAG